GKVSDKEMMVMGESGDDEDCACRVFDSIFDPESKDTPEIALQFFIYNLMLRLNGDGRALKGNRQTVNTVYSLSHLYAGAVKEYRLTEKVVSYASDKLKDCLDEIFDLDGHPEFRRTENTTTCSWCDFRMICGR
ncbi:MAG: hypothetical protein ACI39U_00535, partial [Candidatus Cryptobacteroides sp.]